MTPAPENRDALLERVRGSYTRAVDIRLARALTPCVNHANWPSAVRCPRCRAAFCDACAVFMVNGDAWCEPCGNAIVDTARPRWLLFGLVLLAGWTFVAAMGMAVYLIFKVRFYVWVVVFAAYAAVFRYAWRVAIPEALGNAVRIERRAKGAPLPGRRL